MLVEPGYEPVHDAFLAGQAGFGRGGGAFCGYVDGKKVVDLWGGQQSAGKPWDERTSTVLMSASKGLATLCVQILVDRGDLSLDTLVADVWPEFAQNGKDTILLRHLLLHTAGVLSFPGQTEVTRLDGSGFADYEAIAAGFAAAAPTWEPGSKHGYHALSVGWLLGEVVRRVTGQTLGSFFRKEVAEQLDIEVWVGTPAEEQDRVAQIHPVRSEHLPRLLHKTHLMAKAAMRDPQQLVGQAFLAEGQRSLYDEAGTFFNQPEVLAAEFPAGGATATARALAKLWALMANGGELDGVRLLSREAVDAWAVVVQSEPDSTMAGVETPRLLKGMLGAKVPRTLGYLGNGVMPGLGGRYGPNPEAYGVEGLGGQYGFCDPRSGIAVGFVRSELAMIDVVHGPLTQALYDCAQALGHDVYVAPAQSRPKALVHHALERYLRRRLAVPAV